MKLAGGYIPKIAGRPSSSVEDLSIPEKLSINLQRGRLVYTPVVENLQHVQFGQKLAGAQVEGGTLSLPAPAAGQVHFNNTDGVPSSLTIQVESRNIPERVYTVPPPDQIDAPELRNFLAESGTWPFFWSSGTGSFPSLADERPRSIVINFLATEPFRTRGKVILKRSWHVIMEGIKFVNRLLADYGTIEIMLTEPNDPVTQQMYKDLQGSAWVHLHVVPLLYPVENVRLLDKLIRKASPSLKKEDIVWIIDAQGMEAVGTCLSLGLPLHKRTVAVGGPGIDDPRHVSVRIGTAVSSIETGKLQAEDVSILRGGLLMGETVDPKKTYINFDDDTFFFLPKAEKREFLSFLRPGFKRTSYLPVFVSSVTRAADSQVSTSLRGEIRPCIACGLCETVCPVSLLPQILHRYLFGGNLDEAEKLGLNLCIDCNLCTYICPSKIELQKQFAAARKELKIEQEEAKAILAKKNNIASDKEK